LVSRPSDSREGNSRRTREELGTNAIGVINDASSLTDIDEFTARVRSEFGELDALLICAGQTRFVPFESVRRDILSSVVTKYQLGSVRHTGSLIA
jgi:NAD(P)-dependent dehydrogenase (short-subunit alcohol dehydrogenase family)